MKKLIILNGTMGVGKTRTCQKLNKRLEQCVFLDGDWCWQMDPFIVNEETKAMVEDNIAYLLNNFLRCSEFEHVLFCWVLHKEEILKRILNHLNRQSFDLYVFTLTCPKDALKARIQKDIDRNIRSEDQVDQSIEKSSHFDAMSTCKVDTSYKDIDQVADEILTMIKAKKHKENEDKND